MQYQIVVARYNEDISYLLLLNDILLIYNKGEDNIPVYCNTIKLPNIGRESHTYLYHIVNNYNNLADKTMFIQGKILDHNLLPGKDYFKENDFIARVNLLDIAMLKQKIKHNGKYLRQLKNNDLKVSKYTPYEWINKIGLNISDLNEFNIVWGANFCVSKKLIHEKPKIFYEDLLKYIEYDKNPEEGHFFERSWYLLFNHKNFNLKKIILYDYFDNIDNNIITKCKTLLKHNDIEEIHLWTNNYYNIINNKNFKIYCINNNIFINIYPLIEDNAFKINIIKDINLLVEFENNITYEINFKENIEIFKDNLILSWYINNNNFEYNKFIEYTIKWINNTLFISKQNIIILYVNNIDYLKFKSIKIKGLNTNYDYKSIDNNNIYIYYDIKEFDKVYYKNNFEDYYALELTEYFIHNHYELFD